MKETPKIVPSTIPRISQIEECTYQHQCFVDQAQ